MSIKPHLTLLFALLTISCLTVKAQNSPPAATRASLPAGSGPTVSSIKAAEDMLLTSGAAAQFDKNINAIITQYSAQVPDANRAKFVEVMLKFMTKYSGWEVIKHDIAVLYAREFTENELKQLTAFYKTPLGTKLNAKQPVLMQAGMSIGQQAVMAHQQELQQLVAEVMK